MSVSERVTVKEYDTTDDAKAAENLLLESGLTKDIVSRAGKKIRVVAKWEPEARALLEGAAPTTTTYEAVTVTGYAEGTTSEGGSATDKAKGAASSAAGTVQGAASSATDTVQQAASAVSEKTQAATEAVGTQVSKVTGPAAGQVQSLADTVRQKGASPDAPAIQRQAAQTTANVLDKTSQYLRQGDLGVILEDLRGVVRRRPVPSLLTGLALGFLARGIFSGGGSQGGSQQGLTSGGQGAPADTAVGTAVGYDAAYGAVETVPPAMAGDLATTTDLTTDLATTSDLDAAVGLTTPPAVEPVVAAEDTLGGADLTVADVTVIDTVPPVDAAPPVETGTATDVTPPVGDEGLGEGTAEDDLNPRTGV